MSSASASNPRSTNIRPTLVNSGLKCIPSLSFWKRSQSL